MSLLRYYLCIYVSVCTDGLSCCYYFRYPAVFWRPGYFYGLAHLSNCVPPSTIVCKIIHRCPSAHIIFVVIRFGGFGCRAFMLAHVIWAVLRYYPDSSLVVPYVYIYTPTLVAAALRYFVQLHVGFVIFVG